MRWAIAILLVGTLPAGAALADERELQIALAPELSIVTHGGRTSAGPGGALRVGYGLRDWLAVGGEVSCQRLNALEDKDIEVDGRAGRVVYDSTRCLIGPAVTARLGWVVGGFLSAGLAYRYEHDSTRDLVASNNNLLLHLDDEGHDALVGVVRVGAEYRPWDWLTVGAEGTARLTLAGGPVELDLGVAGILGINVYP